MAFPAAGGDAPTGVDDDEDEDDEDAIVTAMFCSAEQKAREQGPCPSMPTMHSVRLLLRR